MKTTVRLACSLLLAGTAIAEPPVNWKTELLVREKFRDVTSHIPKEVTPHLAGPVTTYHMISLTKPIKMTLDVGSTVVKEGRSEVSFDWRK